MSLMDAPLLDEPFRYILMIFVNYMCLSNLYAGSHFQHKIDGLTVTVVDDQIIFIVVHCVR